MDTITIEGVEYKISSLSDEAKQQIVNIQFADSEIQRLQFQVAVAMTAKNAYLNAFKAAAAEKASK